MSDQDNNFDLMSLNILMTLLLDPCWFLVHHFWEVKG